MFFIVGLNNIKHYKCIINKHPTFPAHNSLYNLEQSMFIGLGSLRYLSLSHNWINAISANVFKHLKLLQSLDLSVNNISQLYDRTIRGPNRLEELYLSNNGLSWISRNSFRGKHLLIVLFCSINVLISFAYRPFYVVITNTYYYIFDRDGKIESITSTKQHAGCYTVPSFPKLEET